jgi:hypothetical protein
MFKLSTNASVVIVVAIGAACAAYLAISESPLASTVIPVIATLVGGAVVQLLKQQDTDAKVEQSTAQSERNTATLAVMAPQVRQAVVQATEAATQASQAVDAVADNTTLTEQISTKADKTHEVFNGAAHEWKAASDAIARLEAEVASLKGMAAGIETGRQRAKDDMAAAAAALTAPESAP